MLMLAATLIKYYLEYAGKDSDH